jgi:hypothetical protein
VNKITRENLEGTRAQVALFYLFRHKDTPVKRAEFDRLLDNDPGLREQYVTAAEAEKWFNTAKRRYMNILSAKRRGGGKRSGSAPDDSHPWVLYTLMTYLDPYLQMRETEGNYEDNSRSPSGTNGICIAVIDSIFSISAI